MYQINAATHIHIQPALICNQKLMKITLQPHFLLLKKAFYEINAMGHEQELDILMTWKGFKVL